MNNEIKKKAKATLTPIELDPGEVLVFTLLSGEERRLTLIDTGAAVHTTNKKDTHDEEELGGTLYRFFCNVLIDGRRMKMERYAGADESFAEPYYVNGMMIWFDAVSDIFELIEETQGECRPQKQARFAVQDMSIPICPDIRPWCPHDELRIRIRECYDGDDCWMGAHHGSSAHNGLDINHPRGTPLFAPIDFDDHYLFDSLENGNNNNRWLGSKDWGNGSVWVLQTHHVVRLLVPEHEPIAAGTHYAEGAGTAVGSHDHSHFLFRIQEDGEEFLLDPWLLFRQIFENEKESRDRLILRMEPAGPAVVGVETVFSAVLHNKEKVNGGRSGEEDVSSLCCFWDFGDGTYGEGSAAGHVYRVPGMYAVTVTGDDGEKLLSSTQHITVDGAAVAGPVLVFSADEEPAFRRRPLHIMDVYGKAATLIPGSIRFTTYNREPWTEERTVLLGNEGGGRLPPPAVMVSESWCSVLADGEGNGQAFYVSADASGLSPGDYRAKVAVSFPSSDIDDCIFFISLRVKEKVPAAETVVVDDTDAGFYAAPYFWIGHRFICGWNEKRGYKGFCLANGGRPDPGEIARFTPELEEGMYVVEFSDETPWKSDSFFTVKVHHAGGDDLVGMRPAASLAVGTFPFRYGSEGYVEILAEGSKGQIYADAVIFRKVE